MNEDIDKINKAKAEGNIDVLKTIAKESFIAGKDNIEQLANDAILEIENMEGKTKTTNSEASQIENHGGNIAEVTVRTGEINKKIEATKANAEKEIQKVENANVINERPEEVKINPEGDIEKTETLKVGEESSLDEIHDKYNKLRTRWNEDLWENDGSLKPGKAEEKKKLDKEMNELKMNFKKKYGYDESIDKLTWPMNKQDANRLVLNKYLDLNLPIFSQVFELSPNDEKHMDMDSKNNKKMLAKKQLEFLKEYDKRMEELEKIQHKYTPGGEYEKIINEYQLETVALREISYAIEQIFNFELTKEDYPADFKPTNHEGKQISIDDFRRREGNGNGIRSMILNLIFHKIAKEKGLIKE